MSILDWFIMPIFIVPKDLGSILPLKGMVIGFEFQPPRSWLLIACTFIELINPKKFDGFIIKIYLYTISVITFMVVKLPNDEHSLET